MNLKEERKKKKETDEEQEASVASERKKMTRLRENFTDDNEKKLEKRIE